MDVLRVIFVFALFVPGSEGLGLGLTKNNHHQVYGVGEHLPILRRCDSRGGADRGGGRAGRQWVMGDECHLSSCHLSAGTRGESQCKTLCCSSKHG